MNCSKCGAENPDNAYFCSSCGHQLQSAMDQPTGPAHLGQYGDEHDGKPIDTNAPGAGLTPPAHQVKPPPPPEPPVQSPVPPVQQPSPPAQQHNYIPATDYSSQPTTTAHKATPPPPPQYPQSYQAPQQGYQQQPTHQAYDQQQSQQYGPPPGNYAPPPGAGYGQQQGQYGSMPGQQHYGNQPYYAQHPSDNTSGMGAGYYEPHEANGWTFAGFVPYGLFSFFNGNTLWGIIGLVTSFFGLYLIYVIYIGIQGKKLAWQGRRFDSVEQYTQTMRTWNTAGIVFLVINLLAFSFFMLVGFIGAMSDAGNY